ncbi:hypothetical protein GVM20_00530 [Porphyrobacter sp. SLTP]|uniref:hypothetical protein n=1 Tax=Porphyrobacter sp. SLTP TaxID=2683266 RepID=UPI0014122617|nr:hypothetical protein [Porphyrobacter sp. SLTP]NBB23608.1 hypothetical protein [Porphyrobacter sp. SLTP]
MRRYRYTLFGVPFCSDIELQLPSAPIGEPLRFQLEECKGAWPAVGAGQIVQEDGDDWVTLRVYSGGGVEIEWRDWLWFWINAEGRSVIYRVKNETYPTAFEAYVGNFAVSACLLLQGEEVLHSTVVQYRGAGLGFLGPSGAGKSTLTAHLIGCGAELVTDDMLRITENNGVHYAEPGQPRLKLFEEAAARHLTASVNKGKWNPVSQKYLFDLAAPASLRAHRPLDALIFLAPPREGAPDKIELRRLEGLELFQTLTSSTMNYRLQTADRLARQFKFARRLAQKLPVYALHYPRRHDILPDVVRTLEETILSKCNAG